MTTKITYIAFDGTEFDNEKDCKNYEQLPPKEIISAIKTLSTFCQKFPSCDICPLTLVDSDYYCLLMKNYPNLWKVGDN